MSGEERPGEDAKAPPIASPSGKKEERVFVPWLVALVALATALKVWMLLHTRGTTDCYTWLKFARLSLERGPFAGFRDVGPTFNHPLLGTLAVSGSVGIARLLGFAYSEKNAEVLAFFVRLPALAGDLLSTFVLARLLSGKMSVEKTRLAVAAFAVSPLVALTGLYHGNTDLLWAALVLLSALLLEREGSRWAHASGAVLACAASVKVAALTAWAPLVVVALRRKSATPFLAGFNVAFLLLFVPPILATLGNGHGHTFIDCIFGYRGALTKHPWPPYGALVALGAHDVIWIHSREIVMGTVFLAALPVAWTGKAGETAAVAIGTSLLVAPVFGLQYLAWLAAPIVVLAARGKAGAAGATVFHASGALYAFVLYDAWSGFRPPYFADALAPFDMPSSLYSVPVWLALALALAATVVPATREALAAVRAERESSTSR